MPQGQVAFLTVSSSCPKRAWYSAKWPWLVRSATRAWSLTLGIHSSGCLVSSFVSHLLVLASTSVSSVRRVWHALVALEWATWLGSLLAFCRYCLRLLPATTSTGGKRHVVRTSAVGVVLQLGTAALAAAVCTALMVLARLFPPVGQVLPSLLRWRPGHYASMAYWVTAPTVALAATAAALGGRPR